MTGRNEADPMTMIEFHQPQVPGDQLAGSPRNRSRLMSLYLNLPGYFDPVTSKYFPNIAAKTSSSLDAKPSG